jgi:hypothetical protein
MSRQFTAGSDAHASAHLSPAPAPEDSTRTTVDMRLRREEKWKRCMMWATSLWGPGLLTVSCLHTQPAHEGQQGAGGGGC